MKRQIFLSVFFCFFRLQIYESIAALFWQSASYVFFGNVQGQKRLKSSLFESQKRLPHFEVDFSLIQRDKVK